MSQIKQLLLLHKQEKNKKEIARLLGISKNTVKSYLEKFNLLNLGVDQLIKLDDPVLEAKFHPGNPAYSDERFEEIKPRLEYYAVELKRMALFKQIVVE